MWPYKQFHNFPCQVRLELENLPYMCRFFVESLNSKYSSSKSRHTRFFFYQLLMLFKLKFISFKKIIIFKEKNQQQSSLSNAGFFFRVSYDFKDIVSWFDLLVKIFSCAYSIWYLLSRTLEQAWKSFNLLFILLQSLCSARTSLRFQKIS